MGRFGLALLIVVLLLGGCRKAADTPADLAKMPADRRDGRRVRPSVGDLHFDVPEAPPEIQKPSPPIPKEPSRLEPVERALLDVAVSEWVIRLTMLPVIVLRKEKPATCLAWLTIVFFEPWIGLGLYLLIGENRLGRRRLARRRSRRPQLEASEYPRVEPDHVVDPNETDDYSVLVHLAEHVGGLPVVAGNSISLMTDTDVVIDRLIADIDAARQHVHLLFYIFKDDSVGRRVAEALVRAAQRGVMCRVLADAVGSRQLFRRLAPSLRQQGVRIFPVLPANLWRMPFARLDLRNHRKLAVIDGTGRLHRLAEHRRGQLRPQAGGRLARHHGPHHRAGGPPAPRHFSGGLVLRVGRIAGRRRPVSA